MARWTAGMAVSSLLVGLFVMSARSATAPGTAGTTDKPNELELPNGKYLILYPKSMRAGQVFSLSIQVFDLVKKFGVTASLTASDGDPSVDEKSVDFETGTHNATINLEVPEGSDVTSYMLTVQGYSKNDDGHPAENGLKFEKQKRIKVHGKGLSIFIQTDKAIYKPSQTVHFRVMAVYPNLKPYLGKLDIELMDADGNKIKQFKGEQNVEHNGVITKELQLTDQPVLGDWKINVQVLGSQQDKSFTVAEYVLPKFEVKIDAPSFFFYRDTLLTFNVGAKYTYGKKVKGTAEIVVNLSYKSYELNKRKIPQHKITVDNFDGSTTVKLTQEELFALILPPSRGGSTVIPLDVLKYKKIQISANVTEGVSGIKLSADDTTVPVETQHHQLKFLAATPSSFKPGLTYVGFVQLSRMDDSPPLPADLIDNNGEAKRLKMDFQGTVSDPKYTAKKNLNESFTIMPSGLVRFFINVPEGFTRLDITATFGFVSETKYGVKKFKSKSDVGIQVALSGLEGGAAVKPNEVTPFKVTSTEPINTFNLEILSKGLLIISKYIHRSEAAKENTVDITFDDATAQKLSPSARVVVWYMTDKNEVITDSLDFNVEGLFSNEVSLSFDKNKTKPGESLNLKVTADPASYVGLLAVDQSVLLLKGGNDITQKDVIAEMKTYDSKDSGSPDPMPMLWRCWFCGWPIFSGGSDSSGVFDNAGVEVLTNALVYKEPMLRWRRPEIRGPEGPFDGAPRGPAGPAAPPAPKNGLTETNSKDLSEVKKVRSEFPETWLWTNAISGSNGETTIEVKAPDTITSWVASAFAVHKDNGLGISPTTSKLTVFQSFFVSLKLPYSIIRGEEFALQAIVFNYLSQAVEVKVTLSQSDKFKVRSVDDLKNATSKEVIVWITVPANEAQSAWFWIVPHELGQIPIEVKAQSHLAADALKRMLLIEPEGTPQQYSKAMIIDKKDDDPVTETVDISYPSDVVNGSEYIKVTAIGDLMGTSVQGLGALLAMPYGCGEQNMLNFAPAIYIMDYLVASSQVTAEVKDKAVKIMETGYMKELTYQHKDGSFSAFGDSDKSGSMWLSAFVVKCFHQAQGYIFVDPALMQKTLRWIINHQNKNGSFSEPPEGRVIHTSMQGGSSKGVPLTAYVLVALVENEDITGGLKTSLDNAIASARSHLEAQLDGIDPYALAIVTYALTVSKSSKAAEALQKLNDIAIKAGGMTHWEVGKAEPVDPSLPVWQRYHHAGASNIEMSAIALLVYTANKDKLGGIPIIKWLASQQGPNGGFSSTQDTVLALQAMAELSGTLSHGDSLRLDITLTVDGVDYKFDQITKDNAAVMQSKQLPSSTKQVVITAKGQGLGVVQVAVSYYVDSAENKPGVVVNVRTKDLGNGVTKINACGKYTKEGQSGMTVMEVGLISGNQADTSGLAKQVPSLKRFEAKDRKMVFYFDEFTERDTCVEIVSRQVLPVTHPQKAYVEGYSYYKPEMKDSKTYLPQALAQTHMCTSCKECCGIKDNVGASQSNGAICVMNIILLVVAAVCNFLIL